MVSYPRDPDDAKLAEFDVYAVTPAAKPGHDPITQDVVEDTPEWIGSTLTQQWQVVAASAEEIAERAAVATTLAERTEIQGDGFVGTFIAMTPAAVEAYVEANVTDMASAKALLKKMAKMILLLVRREFG
jgi:hypothetical protein